MGSCQRESHSNSNCSTNDRGVRKIVAIKKPIIDIEKIKNESLKSLTQKDQEIVHEMLAQYYGELWNRKTPNNSKFL